MYHCGVYSSWLLNCLASNGGTMTNKLVEMGYRDWTKLLEDTNNLDMLNDPFNVWIEAFHVGTMLERHGCAALLQKKINALGQMDKDTQMKPEDIKIVFNELIEEILSKGASRV